MLTKRIDELSKGNQDTIWQDDNWYLEEKINGIRCLLVKDETGLHVVSRFNSKETLLPIELSVLFKNLNLGNIDNFMLDCELTSNNGNTCNYLSTKGLCAYDNTQALDLLLLNMSKVQSVKLQEEFNFNLVFNVFDCLCYSNSWVINEPLEKRRNLVKSLVLQLKDSNIPLRHVPYTNQNKQDFYNVCLNSGLEGCVAKHKDYIYAIDSSRSKNGWVKIKKNTVMSHNYDPNKPFSLDELFSNKSTGVSSIVSPFSDTIDAFITGYQSGEKGTLSEGYVNSLEVSVYVDGDIKSLGYVSNMSSDLRTQITTIVNGIPTLTPIFFNKVVELSSDAETIIKVRYDKSSTDCTLSKNIFDVVSRN